MARFFLTPNNFSIIYMYHERKFISRKRKKNEGRIICLSKVEYVKFYKKIIANLIFLYIWDILAVGLGLFFFFKFSPQKYRHFSLLHFCLEISLFLLLVTTECYFRMYIIYIIQNLEKGNVIIFPKAMKLSILWETGHLSINLE